MLVPQLIIRPVTQEMETPVEQSKLPVPESSRICDKIIPDYAIPHISSGDDSIIKGKTTQDVSKKIPIYTDPVYRPPPKPVKLPIPKVPRSLLDLDPEINTNFENSPFREGVISEMYQRPDKSYFKEPQTLDSLINTVRLVQMFLPKQADIDKM